MRREKASRRRRGLLPHIFTLASGADIIPSNVKKSQDIDGKMTDNGQIVRAIVYMKRAIIFLKGNVKDMVEGCLNPPMFANHYLLPVDAAQHDVIDAAFASLSAFPRY